MPKVVATSDDGMAYLQTDLGDLSLYDRLVSCRTTGHYDEEACHLLEETTRQLAAMQIRGDEGLDYDNICYPASPFDKLVALPRFSFKAPRTTLLVTVYSFSYRMGIPDDPSGNGGGFVFDCRSIHNPGRYPQYATLTGLDEPVIHFLKEKGEITPFIEHAGALVDEAVKKYVKRGFTHLQVAFGCTGGQHRLVYAAQALAISLHEKYPEIEVQLIHREQHITTTYPSRKAQ